MTKGMVPPGPDEAQDDRESELPPARTPTVIWVHDGPVCVDVVDVLPHPVAPANCQCQACVAARHADWAARFLD